MDKQITVLCFERTYYTVYRKTKPQNRERKRTNVRQYCKRWKGKPVESDKTAESRGQQNKP